MSSQLQTPALSDLGNYEQAVVDFGNAVNLTAAISYPMDHLQQMWLVAAQVESSSNTLLRVEMRGPTGLRWRPSLTNQQGGAAIFIPGSAGAVVSYNDFSMPRPLLEESYAMRTGSQDLTFTFNVTDATGAAVTYTRLVLWFALTKADQKLRWCYPTLGQAGDFGYVGTRTY